MGTLIVIALRNLLQHRRRTLLLGGALSLVTSLLVLLLGLSGGMSELMLRAATTLMTGHINVAGFYKVTAGQSAPVVTGYKEVLTAIKEDVPELAYAVERGRGWGKVISDTASMQVGISGIDLQSEKGIQKVVQVLEGDVGGLSEPNTTLIFAEQAKRLEVKVGDMLTLSTSTPRGVANTMDVRIVAIAENMGLLSNFAIFVPNVSLRSLYQINDDTTGALHLYLKDMSDIPLVSERLRTSLAARGFKLMDHNPVPYWGKFEGVNREDWTGQKLDITVWEDEISFLTWTLKSLDGLTGALISILMVIIIVGIMNTMWIAVRERTREIGTLRAIGMQRRTVMGMFLLETGLLGFAGTCSGALMGIAAGQALNAAQLDLPAAARLFLMSNTLNVTIQPAAVVGSILSITLAVTLAAVLPARRAAGLKPITAMHHVG